MGLGLKRDWGADDAAQPLYVDGGSNNPGAIAISKDRVGVGAGMTAPIWPFQCRAGQNKNIGFSPAFGPYTSGSVVIAVCNDAVTTGIPLDFDATSYCFHTGKVGLGVTSPASGLHIAAGAGGTRKGYVTLEDIANGSEEPAAPGDNKCIIYFRNGALRAKIGSNNTEKTFTLT